MTESELWAAYNKNRSIKNRNALWEFHQPLAIATATKFHRKAKKLDFSDLVSWANFGLVRSIERFDAGHKVSFKSFAFWRMRGAIQDFLRAQDWVPRLNRSRGDDIMCRQVSRADLKCRLSAPRDNNELELLDEVKAVFMCLTPSEKKIFRAYYFEGLTLKAIGKRMGVSESRIAQIHSSAILRIRQSLADELK